MVPITDLHDGDVPVDTYASQEQDAAVHVDEVGEDVQVGAEEAGPPAVVQQDAGGQGEVHQQVRDRQVDGVDHRGGLGLCAQTKDVERHCVEHHAHLHREDTREKH